MIKWGCAAYVLESWCNLLVCSSIVLLTWQQEKQKLSLQPSDEISINLSEATVKRNDEREGSKITHTCTQLKCRGDARGEAQSSGDRKRRLWRLFSWLPPFFTRFAPFPSIRRCYWAPSFHPLFAFSPYRRMWNGWHRRSYVLCCRRSPKLEDLVPRVWQPKIFYRKIGRCPKFNPKKQNSHTKRSLRANWWLGVSLMTKKHNETHSEKMGQKNTTKHWETATHSVHRTGPRSAPDRSGDT